MIGAFLNWLEKRKRLRQRWQQDARTMIMKYDRHAYYESQRMAARSRARGVSAEFWHWAKVAAEVARLSPTAEMDMKVVQASVDEEMHRHRQV